MRSHTSERFRDAFTRLPPAIQERAQRAYRLFEQNPQHPSLQFKPIQGVADAFSARINDAYRALGARKDDDIVWFWIGSHADYDRLVSRLS